MVKRAVFTPDAPSPVGAYSQAILAGEFLSISGQISLDPKTGELVGKSPGEQMEMVMKNIGAILSCQGLTFSHLVKVRIYTTDLNYFREINEVYTKFFDKEPPARVFVGVSQLPLGALVEVEAEAYAGKKLSEG